MSAAEFSDSAPDERDLTDQEKRILELEAEQIRDPGHKLNAIYDRFERMSWVQYNYLLSRLLNKRAALEHDPVLVNRLRRLRQQGIEKSRRIRGA